MKSSQLKIVCDQVQYDFNFQHSLVTNDPEMMVSVLSDYGISTSVQIARELIVNLKKGIK
jgi:hypothetical protein|tara:strand:- start:28 stop:207 length:180 start_codon:yes stop_codon:yes gene_type:complete